MQHRWQNLENRSLATDIDQADISWLRTHLELYRRALIVDAGKGCLFPEAVLRANERDLTLLRVDIRPGFEGQVAMLLEMERQLQASTGRATLGGVNIVSGGLLGRTGEFVVDSVHEPTVIYGLADGCGDLVRDLSVEQLKQLRSLRNLIRVEVG